MSANPFPSGGPLGSTPRPEDPPLAGESATKGPFGGPLDSLFSHLKGLTLPSPTSTLVANAEDHWRSLRIHLRGVESMLQDLRVENSSLAHAIESATRESRAGESRKPADGSPEADSD